MLPLDVLRTIAIAAGLGTLLVAVAGILGAAKRATAAGSRDRRLPAWVLFAMSAAFSALMVVLWIPLPISLPAAAEGVVKMRGRPTRAGWGSGFRGRGGEV